MRRYEVMAQGLDGIYHETSRTAPATALFEETATAFARGTPVPTRDGDIPVEDLMPGDEVMTRLGPQPVLWIGSTHYVPGHEIADSVLGHLTRITAEAFGPGRPGFDMLLGPTARMRVRHSKLQGLIGQDSVLAPVADYADGDRLLRVTPAGSVQLYHLMLPHHTMLEIGGLELESYHPGSGTLRKMDAETRERFMGMFPHIREVSEFGEVNMTRTSREVVDSLCDL